MTMCPKWQLGSIAIVNNFNDRKLITKIYNDILDNGYQLSLYQIFSYLKDVMNINIVANMASL